MPIFMSLVNQGKVIWIISFHTKTTHRIAIAISEYGKLRKATSKSDFLECLESLIEVTHDAAEVSMQVIDGAAFVNMNRPKVIFNIWNVLPR